jgi:hypothetical protein
VNVNEILHDQLGHWSMGRISSTSHD